MTKILTSEVTTLTTFYIQSCCNCHILFGMPQELEDSRREDKERFYCPNGHGQSYRGKSDDQLRREAIVARDQTLTENRRLANDNGRLADDNMSLAKKNRTMRARAKAGMCSKCNRPFKNYASNMETKHGAKAKATPKAKAKAHD